MTETQLTKSGPLSLIADEPGSVLLEYCPGGELSMCFRLINKWMPAFWISLYAIFLVGAPTGWLDALMIGLGRTMLVPFKTVLASPAAGGLAPAIDVISWASIPAFLCLGAALAAWTVHETGKPTNIKLTQSGFALCSSTAYRPGSRLPSRFVYKTYNWLDIVNVSLERPRGKGSSLDYRLEFRFRSGEPLSIRYGDIETPRQRIHFMEMLQSLVPQDRLAEDVCEVFSSPQVRQSYTEMWLRELSAPPKRDKLTPLAPGAQLQDGLYTVDQRLGIGGQGTVYLARSSKLQADSPLVALKEFILPVFPDPRVRVKAAERFQVEAEMLSRLSHPQIVKFLELFIEDHRAYLVLERVEGLNLKQKVCRDGPMAEADVIAIAVQLCDILDYLHNQDPPVTHRDFTPDNLILGSDGLVKLIDFSVAQQIQSAVTGSIVGKLSYVSPEQFRGKASPQSDIYSLGATLSFLLTGEEPEAIKVSHPRSRLASVSETLDAVIARATALDPASRFARICDMKADLLSLPNLPALPSDSLTMEDPAGA